MTIVGLLFCGSYRFLPGKHRIAKGVLVGILVWLIMGLLFFAMLGLGPFAWNIGLGVRPALFSLAMVLTYSMVMGAVYAAMTPTSNLLCVVEYTAEIFLGRRSVPGQKMVLTASKRHFRSSPNNGQATSRAP